MNTVIRQPSQAAKPPRPSLAQTVAGLEEELAQTTAKLAESETGRRLAEAEVTRLREQVAVMRSEHEKLQNEFVKRVDVLTADRDGAKLHNAEVNARLRDCANRLLDIWRDDEKFHQQPEQRINHHALAQRLRAPSMVEDKDERASTD